MPTIISKGHISAKVIEIGDTNTIEDGRRFQTILLADHTGTAELALWEDFVGAVNNRESYTFNYLTVKIFHKPSLFTPRENAMIEKTQTCKMLLQPIQSSVQKKFNMLGYLLSQILPQFTSALLVMAVLPITSSKTDTTFGKCSECRTVVQMESSST